MRTRNKVLTAQNNSQKSPHALSPSRSFWIVVAALWLQGVVMVSILLEIKRHVHAPANEWLEKIIDLLGM
jgi:hypothetical protein